VTVIVGGGAIEPVSRPRPGPGRRSARGRLGLCRPHALRALLAAAQHAEMLRGVRAHRMHRLLALSGEE